MITELPQTSGLKTLELMSDRMNVSNSHDNRSYEKDKCTAHFLKRQSVLLILVHINFRLKVASVGTGPTFSDTKPRK